MVFDEEPELPHTVAQKSVLAPSLVAFGPAVGEHRHAGRPVFLVSVGSCCGSVSIQTSGRRSESNHGEMGKSKSCSGIH